MLATHYLLLDSCAGWAILPEKQQWARGRMLR